jgi:hypothetical protein
MNHDDQLQVASEDVTLLESSTVEVPLNLKLDSED